VAYRGAEFYVHLDRLIDPPSDDWFVEVKSRTWSRRDARDKAAIITDLLALFGASPDDTISDGYVDLAASTGGSRKREPGG
jgi:5-methylthioadenosine/S-adenosylhomocysteine deaminase